MITYQKIDRTFFELYDQIPMLVHVKSEMRIEKINRGLGGMTMKEVPVQKPYIKDLGTYDQATKYEERFDISNWAFYLAFDHGQPVGAVTIAAKTSNVTMLDGRDDLAVLWDIRVADAYKAQGIGQALFDLAVDWSKSQGLSQLKIECQHNNVPAIRFYHKQGAVLSKIDEYAYFHEPACRNEVQLIWYLNL